MWTRCTFYFGHWPHETCFLHFLMYTRVSQRFWSHHPISSSMSPCILLDEGRSMAASTCDCQWSTWSFRDSKSYRLQCLSKELWLGLLPHPRMLSWQMKVFFFRDLGIQEYDNPGGDCFRRRTQMMTNDGWHGNFVACLPYSLMCWINFSGQSTWLG